MYQFRRTIEKGKPSISLNELQIQMRNQVQGKVNSGEYGFESVSCLLCDNSNCEAVTDQDRYGLSFSVQLCKICGLMYTSPRMTAKAYGEFYDNEYRPLYVGKARAGDDFFNEQKRQGQRIYNYLVSSGQDLSKPLRVLEVGCGAGGILETFRSKGHTVLGLDLGSEYVAFGKENYGLDLRVGFLSTLALDFAPDLIIYSHVMEHILNPLQEMQEIKKHAGENTLVYVEVPGVKNIHKGYEMDIMKYYQNAHSVHFTLTSLSSMMLQCGFGLISGDEYVHSVFSPSKAVFDFENEYVSTRDYLIKTERTRWQYPYTLRALKGRVKRWMKAFTS